MRTLNLITVMMSAAIFAGCVSSRRIEDHAANRSSTCEVHHIAMTQKRVEMTYGMRRDDWTMALRLARPDQFPHADEVCDTYACCPSYENYALIYVCPDCTTARVRWLESHPQRP